MTDPAPQSYEINPDPHELTAKNTSADVDYEPHPEKSIKLGPEHQKIVDAVNRLYDGKAQKEDMYVYAEKSVYDDPWSYCDTRYKIAGQWWGIPMVFTESKTLQYEVVEDEKDRIIYKKTQRWTPKLVHFTKDVNSLVTLSLDEEGKVKYHKEMWNEKVG
jgi:hypothetical protein